MCLTLSDPTRVRTTCHSGQEALRISPPEQRPGAIEQIVIADGIGCREVSMKRQLLAPALSDLPDHHRPLTAALRLDTRTDSPRSFSSEAPNVRAPFQSDVFRGR